MLTNASWEGYRDLRHDQWLSTQRHSSQGSPPFLKEHRRNIGSSSYILKRNIWLLWRWNNTRPTT